MYLAGYEQDQQGYNVLNISVNGGTSPSLKVSPSPLSFGSLPLNTTSSQYLYIENDGDYILSWSLSKTLSCLPACLSTDQTNGVVPPNSTGRILVTVNTNGLTAGYTYSGNIGISSSFGSASIPVSFTVSQSNSIILYPTKDSYIWDVAYTTNYYNSNPLVVWEYEVSGVSHRYQSLMYFDISTIPANSMINKASLNLFITNTPSPSGGELKLQQLGSTWTETGVTYNNQPQFSNDQNTSISIPSSASNSYVAINVLGFVNDWYNNWLPNNGFGLSFPGTYLNNGIDNIHLEFNSRESSSNKPKLIIDYSPVDPTFLLNANPSFRKITIPSGSTTFTVNSSSLAGFSGTINLQVLGMPSNSSYSFNPSIISVGSSSTLNINTSASTPKGIYPITIYGTSGSKTNSYIATLQIGNDQKPILTITSIEDNLEAVS